MTQMQHHAVCQKCGRSLPIEDAIADGWLVDAWWKDISIKVVRCYRHITEWSLRSSMAGRTNYWIKKMEEGKERARTEPQLHPAAEPFPLEDR